MDVMTPEGVKPFADPQTYDVTDENPTAVAPVFRSTLKKLQGRWTGELPGIDGKAEFAKSARYELDDSPSRLRFADE